MSGGDLLNKGSLSVFLVMLVFVSLTYADYDLVKEYDTDYGTVVRELHVYENKSYDIFALKYVYSYRSVMTIKFTNRQPLVKEVLVKETLGPYSQPNFDPEPYSQSDDRVVWKFTDVPVNRTVEMIIEDDGLIDNETFLSMPAPDLTVTLKKVRLLVPNNVSLGEELTISVVDEDNMPVQIPVEVVYPDGRSVNITLNSDGIATLIPEDQGYYVVRIPEFNIEKKVNVFKPLPVNQTLTTAAMTGQSDKDRLMVFLPVLVMLVIIAAILFGVIVLYAPRRRDETDDIDNLFTPKVETVERFEENRLEGSVPEPPFDEKPISPPAPIEHKPYETVDKADLEEKIKRIKELAEEIKKTQKTQKVSKARTVKKRSTRTASRTDGSSRKKKTRKTRTRKK